MSRTCILRLRAADVARALTRQAKEVFDYRAKSLLLSRHKRHITIDCDSVVSYPNLRTHLGRTESCPAKRGLAGQFSRIGGAFMAKDKKTMRYIIRRKKGCLTWWLPSRQKV